MDARPRSMFSSELHEALLVCKHHDGIPFLEHWERFRLKLLLLRQQLLISRVIAAIVALQMLCFVIEEETRYSTIYTISGPIPNLKVDASKFSSYGFICFMQIIFSLCCFASAFMSVRLQIVEQQELWLKRQLPSALPRILPSVWAFRIVPQTLLLMFNIPPFVFSSFSTYSYFNDHIVYPVRIFNAFCFLRFFVFLDWMRLESRSKDQSLRRLLYLSNSSDDQAHLAFKTYFTKHSVKILGLCLITGISFFAYLLVICERYNTVFKSIYPENFLQQDGYAHCWWLIWTVMLTLGLGDWVPVSPIGRLVTILSSFCGILLSALFIGEIARGVQFSSDELGKIATLQSIRRSKRQVPAAVRLIQLWWRRVAPSKKVLRLWTPASAAAAADEWARARHEWITFMSKFNLEELQHRMCEVHLSDNVHVIKEEVAVLKHQLNEQMSEISAQLSAVLAALPSASSTPPHFAASSALQHPSTSKTSLLLPPVPYDPSPRGHASPSSFSAARAESDDMMAQPKELAQPKSVNSGYPRKEAAPPPRSALSSLPLILRASRPLAQNVAQLSAAAAAAAVARHVTPPPTSAPRFSRSGRKLEEGDVEDGAGASGSKPWRIF